MMLLAVPSPSPSGINVTVNVPTDWALDTFTGVLALFTIALAIIGGIALRFQRREIKAIETQLKPAQVDSGLTSEQVRLAHDEFDASRRAARPLLTVSAALPNEQYMTGQVDWVNGSEPAFDVKVWGRGPAGY